MEVRKIGSHQVRQGKMYRKIVTGRILLNDYWVGVELCQDRNHLDFIYMGLTPDETSDVCLNNEYEKVLMWHTMLKK